MVAPAAAVLGRVGGRALAQRGGALARGVVRSNSADQDITLGVTQFDDTQVRALLRELGPRGGRTKRAMVQGINEGARQVRTTGRKEVSSTLNLPARRINRAVNIIPGNQAKITQPKPTAILSSDDDFLSLTTYGARTFGGRRRSRQRVEVQIFKNQGRKVLKGAFIRSTSGARDSGGTARQVFKRRRGATRYPIRRMFGPRVGYVFHKPQTIRRMDARADRVVPNVIERRLRLELRRAEEAAARR